jgi:hypothetical protein
MSEAKTRTAPGPPGAAAQVFVDVEAIQRPNPFVAGTIRHGWHSHVEPQAKCPTTPGLALIAH